MLIIPLRNTSQMSILDLPWCWASLRKVKLMEQRAFTRDSALLLNLTPSPVPVGEDRPARPPAQRCSSFSNHSHLPSFRIILRPTTMGPLGFAANYSQTYKIFLHELYESVSGSFITIHRLANYTKLGTLVYFVLHLLMILCVFLFH